MEALVLLVGSLLIFVGFLGCIIPALPGPPIAWLGYLLVFLLPKSSIDYSSSTFVACTILAIGVTVLDYYLPIWGTKKSGGTKAGQMGSFIGLFVGLFLGPFGMLLGAFAGAVVGELWAGQDDKTALKSGLGAFLGFLIGTVAKVFVTGYIAFAFYTTIF